MSNLSELLPAGGAAKEFEPVASGTLPNGQAVILNANGTITAVAETALSQTIPAGSGAEFDSGSNPDGIMMAYDPCIYFSMVTRPKSIVEFSNLRAACNCYRSF